MAKREKKPSSSGNGKEKKPSSRKAKESVAEKTQRAQSSFGSDHSRIRERAYELYLKRGDSPGDDVTDWLTAEREFQQ